MLTIADIVLNHTANESQWLREHPECTYNMVNCPYLIPAYLLDVTLHNFSLEISKGIWEMQGIPAVVNKEEHLGVSVNLLCTFLRMEKHLDCEPPLANGIVYRVCLNNGFFHSKKDQPSLGGS